MPTNWEAELHYYFYISLRLWQTETQIEEPHTNNHGIRLHIHPKWTTQQNKNIFLKIKYAFVGVYDDKIAMGVE